MRLDRYDPVAVDIVCIERVPMRLLRADRVEAVRRLSAKGLGTQEIGRLLKSSSAVVNEVQRRYGIEVLPRPTQISWHSIIVSKRQRERHNARRRERDRALVVSG